MITEIAEPAFNLTHAVLTNRRQAVVSCPPQSLGCAGGRLPSGEDDCGETKRQEGQLQLGAIAHCSEFNLAKACRPKDLLQDRRSEVGSGGGARSCAHRLR